MPRGSVGETVGGMFDDLKSRLGFNQEDERYDDFAGPDAYAGQDEFADFDEYAEYGEAYDDNAPVGGYKPLTTASLPNRYAASDITSNLVSINDVKATTPFPDLDSVGQPYVPVTAHSAGQAARSDQPAASQAPTASAPSFTAPTTYQPASDVSASYDPYEAYAGTGASTHVPSRALTVVKPVSYGDVERVARAVKSGDVVVLALRYTPDDLSKRILDFSFGVASALDANVECPGDKVFAIARGNALTPEEKRTLDAQGVL